METIKTWDLPQLAKTRIDVIRDGDKKETITVTFKKMDGIYGQRFDDKGEVYNFNANFKKIDGDFYEITE